MIPKKRSESNETENQYVKFFKFYGVRLATKGQQLQGTCPFTDCGRDDHFFANPATGQWDCKICSRTGNTYTFAKEIHGDCRAATTDALYDELADLRIGIRIPTFEKFGVAYNHRNGDWLLPAYSLENKLTNLYAWKEIMNQETKEWSRKVLAGPTFKQTMYGLQFFRPKSKFPVWILEGHWDTHAWYDVLCAIKNPATGKKLIEEHDILGCPGVGVFPKEYCSLINGRDVRVLFDNDLAGKNGVDHIIKTISQHGCIPARFQVLQWPTGTPNKFDVRDQVVKSFE